jgi:DNA phosphorothioation-dependent restriction protein DptH
LVDYVPGANSSSGHQLIITSRSTAVLRAALRQALGRYGVESGEEQAAAILNALRSLSGRLALKFMSARSHQAEALGLAVARLFLEEQGALSNQIVLPLDSHLDLFRVIKSQAAEAGEGWSLQRTDLALFDLNAQARTIRCNLVEVKFYRQIGGVGEYQRLKELIAVQIRQSEEVLRRHFDPDLRTPDRADRLLKTREFSTLLKFYLDRARRYRLLDVDAAAEAQEFLSRLEEGYKLEFSRSAVIFTLDEDGPSAPEAEFGIDFYRVGANVVKNLVGRSEAAGAHSESLAASTNAPMPKFTTAPFIAPKQERPSTWGKLAERSVSAGPDISNEGEKSEHHPAGTGEVSDKSPQIIPKVFEGAGAQVPGEGGAGLGAPVAVTFSSDTRAGDEPADRPKTTPQFGVMLGAAADTPQYGIIGETAGRKVALDLNQTHTISLFGVQGGGKSYTLGSIVEMTCMPISNINVLPSPLATVIFHYSPTQEYRPEFTSMVEPNSEAEQIAALRARYGAEPQAISDVVLLVPSGKLAEREAEYPGIAIQPISFNASELKAAHWKFLMGAVGSQSMYLRQVNLIMRKLRESLTLETLLQAVEESQLSEHLKELARTRLEFAAEYIDDTRPRLTNTVLPGRLIIVDLRDEFIDKDEALGLFVVLLQIFSEATAEGRAFNKMVVFDEAHKYIESQDLVTGLIEVVREMRHRGTSIIIASQDPPSVPVPLIELSTQMVLHKFNSPAWLKHLQKANASLGNLSADRMTSLGAGEAYVWSSKATDDSFTRGAIKIKCRPRVTRHGGGTKTAIKSDM